MTVPVEFGSVVGVWVECKRDLIVSLAMLVLERTIVKKDRL